MDDFESEGINLCDEAVILETLLATQFITIRVIIVVHLANFISAQTSLGRVVF